MDTNFSLRNVNIIKSDSGEAKSVKKADSANFNDAVIDGTNTNQAELLKDVEGAMNAKDNVFIKTDKGIIKIDRDKVPEVLASLKEKLLKKDEYKVTGIGLDSVSREFKVSFKTPDGERSETIHEARKKANQALGEGNKEYNQEVSNALKIADPGKRSDALQKAADKFKGAIQKVNEGLIGEIKAANDKYLEIVKANDPKHFPEIKKAADENTSARINAIGEANNNDIKAVQIHSEFTKAAGDIANPHKRQAALNSATTDFNNSIDTSIKANKQTVANADSKFSIALENVKTEVSKAPEHRSEAIHDARKKANQALGEGGKLYDQEISDALKIADPGKRSDALQKAADKFKGTIQKVNEGLIGEIKAANDKYLEIVKVNDPKHYPEIKKAADENTSARIDAVGNANNNDIKAVQGLTDKTRTAADIASPQKRQAALNSANADFSNNLDTSIKANKLAVDKADSKFKEEIKNIIKH
jgi:hypothetical protein